MAGNSDLPSNSVSSFNCPSCGAAVVIRAAGITLTAVCSACGAICDSENGNFKLVKKAHELLNIKPLIELGTKGKIRGQIFQLIGFMRRFEKEYPNEPWDEYLFFNPFNGYCWLVEYKGHWNFYKVTKNSPKNYLGSKIDFLGDKYQIFHKGNAVVQFVVGEFYWRVRVGDSVKTLDAIYPPHILSKEQDGSEVIWSIGEYLEPQEVEAAFHPKPMPVRHGVAPSQPSKSKGAGEAWAAWFLILLALVMIQIIGKSVKPEKIISGTSLSIPITGLNETEILKFSTEGISTHVAINVHAKLEQSWTSMKLRVVSDDPLKTTNHTFEKELSYYFGRDGGEYWSEGSQNAEFLVNGLPRGDYHVLISATAEPGHTADVLASIVVSPSIWSNFWLAILILCLPPVWMSFRSKSFEINRWSESEFKPF